MAVLLNYSANIYYSGGKNDSGEEKNAFTAVLCSDISNRLNKYFFLHSFGSSKESLHLAQSRPPHHSQVHGSKR